MSKQTAWNIGERLARDLGACQNLVGFPVSDCLATLGATGPDGCHEEAGKAIYDRLWSMELVRGPGSGMLRDPPGPDVVELTDLGCLLYYLIEEIRSRGD